MSGLATSGLATGWGGTGSTLGCTSGLGGSGGGGGGGAACGGVADGGLHRSTILTCGSTFFCQLTPNTSSAMNRRCMVDANAPEIIFSWEVV